ncbi:MAG: hypothetical protein IPJ65_10390 [Archangiaceae bacterium]|nr:hypothetical protein [Archangiaceae bacterium]
MDDIPRWLELASTGSREMYDAAALAVLPEVWRTWVSEGRCEIHCLVDDSRPVAEQVQGVVSGVFVTDAFADGLVAQPSSSLAAEVVRREASGRSVVLKPAEVAAANSNGGVNGLGIDFAFAGGWSALTLIRWTRVLFESVREWGYGWRVRTALREWIGQDTMLMARATGWPVLRDFSRGLKKKPPLLRRRYFSAYTLQDYRAAPTRLPAALFFDYQEPRFRFTPAEQQLLVLAVRGLTDAEAAEVLDLSAHRQGAVEGHLRAGGRAAPRVVPPSRRCRAVVDPRRGEAPPPAGVAEAAHARAAAVGALDRQALARARRA